MRYFIVTHPFVVSVPTQRSSEYRRYALHVPPEKSRFGCDPGDHQYKLRLAAWEGHRSGPFTKLEDAEKACADALATGCFYQVEIREET